MSSIDPATFAAQFAQIEIQPFKQRYQLQTNTYQSQLSALGKVESAMREFRTALNEMNSSTNSIIKKLHLHLSRRLLYCKCRR